VKIDLIVVLTFPPFKYKKIKSYLTTPVRKSGQKSLCKISSQSGIIWHGVCTFDDGDNQK